MGTRQAAPAPPAPPLPPVSIDERLQNAARSMSQNGMAAAQIAQPLGLDEASVQTTLALQPPATDGIAPGRVLGSALQAELDKLLLEEPDLCCPITMTLCVDPVIASDGFMYDKESLLQLLKQPSRHGLVSPMTREQLTRNYLPARQRKSEALEFRLKRSQELLAFAAKAASEKPRLASDAIERVEEYLPALGASEAASLKQGAEELRRKLNAAAPGSL